MIYKADTIAADRALKAACKHAVTLLRWGHEHDRHLEARVDATFVLAAAGNTVALMIDEGAP